MEKLCTICGGVFNDSVDACPTDHKRLVLNARRLLGSTLGERYLVVEDLYLDDFLIVLLARDQRLGRDVIIKSLSVNPEQFPNRLSTLNQERAAYCRLEDPRFPRVYDSGELRPGWPFVVYERLGGRRLEDIILDEAPLPVTRSIRLATQIGSALSAAHDFGMVHGALSPNCVNVQTDPAGLDQVRITDFGLTRITGIQQDLPTGRVVRRGRDEYTSPEQWRGEQIGASSDIYALGLMLYEMLSARRPFDAPNRQDLRSMVLSRRAPLLTERNPAIDVPRVLEDLVAQMIARQVEDRPSDMVDVCKRLAACLDPTGTRVRPADSPEDDAARVLTDTDWNWLAGPLDQILPERPAIDASELEIEDLSPDEVPEVALEDSGPFTLQDIERRARIKAARMTDRGDVAGAASVRRSTVVDLAAAGEAGFGAEEAEELSFDELRIQRTLPASRVNADGTIINVIARADSVMGAPADDGRVKPGDIRFHVRATDPVPFQRRALADALAEADQNPLGSGPLDVHFRDTKDRPLGLDGSVVSIGGEPGDWADGLDVADGHVTVQAGSELGGDAGSELGGDAGSDGAPVPASAQPSHDLVAADTLLDPSLAVHARTVQSAAQPAASKRPAPDHDPARDLPVFQITAIEDDYAATSLDADGDPARILEEHEALASEAGWSADRGWVGTWRIAAGVAMFALASGAGAAWWVKRNQHVPTAVVTASQAPPAEVAAAPPAEVAAAPPAGPTLDETAVAAGYRPGQDQRGSATVRGGGPGAVSQPSVPVAVSSLGGEGERRRRGGIETSLPAGRSAAGGIQLARRDVPGADRRADRQSRKSVEPSARGANPGTANPVTAATAGAPAATAPPVTARPSTARPGAASQTAAKQAQPERAQPKRASRMSASTKPASSPAKGAVAAGAMAPAKNPTKASGAGAASKVANKPAASPPAAGSALTTSNNAGALATRGSESAAADSKSPTDAGSNKIASPKRRAHLQSLRRKLKSF